MPIDPPYYAPEDILEFGPSINDLMPPQLPGMPPDISPMEMPPIEDPPIEGPADPPNASGIERAEIVKWVKEFMKASREYIKRKEADFDLWSKLYNNELTRSEWATWNAASTQAPGSAIYARSSVGQYSEAEDDAAGDWSEFVYSPTHLIDSWIDSAYPLLFNNAEFLIVNPDNPRGPNIEDMQYPTARKLQQLLLAKLDEGHIHARVYDCLKSMCVLGTVYAKMFWFSRAVPRWKWDLEQVERIQDDNLISECPILQIIPPDKVLVDPDAEHSDINRWRGMGYWVEKPYSVVLEGFRRGTYQLNEAKFKEKFKNSKRRIGRPTSGIPGDPDKFNLDDPEEGWVRVWELHCSAPTSNGLKENVTTIVTECDVDDPSDGIEIRITKGPILDCGLRPFLSAQFSPEMGPFGKGQIERNLDLLYEISTLIGQFQDNAKLTCHTGLSVIQDSDADRQLKKNGDILTPGFIARKQEGQEDPIKKIDLSGFPAAEIKALIQDYLALLERRFVSETFQGVSTREKSATESNLIFQQAMTPVQTRIDLFARQFLGPAGQLALAMLQQFLLEDQILTVKNDMGQDQPMLITVDEIQSGRYRVMATLSRQDQQRTAKASIVQQILPIAANLKQIVSMEGQDIRISELFKQLLIYLDVEKADKIVVPLPPPPPGMMPPGMPPGPPNMIAPPGPPGMPPPGMPPLSPPELPLAKHGGPMGQEPTEANIGAQNIQMDRLRERGGQG